METTVVIIMVILSGMLAFGIYRAFAWMSLSSEQRQSLRRDRRELTKQEIRGCASLLASPLFWVGIVTLLTVSRNDWDATNDSRNTATELSKIGTMFLAVGAAYVIRWSYRWLNEKPRRQLGQVVRANIGFIVFGTVWAIIAFWLFLH